MTRAKDTLTALVFLWAVYRLLSPARPSDYTRGYVDGQLSVLRAIHAARTAEVAREN
jgi:hypothetical protein